jgi:hypothetical protein
VQEWQQDGTTFLVIVEDAIAFCTVAFLCRDQAGYRPASIGRSAWSAGAASSFLLS